MVSAVRTRASLALCAGLLVGACGNDHGPPDGRPGEPTLAAIRQDIFSTTCGLSSCHAPPTLAARLNLRDNGLCSLLVRHASCLFSNRVLVVPGKPEGSFLIDKLRGTNLTGEPDPSCGVSNMQMPIGPEHLPDEKIAQIEQWIRDGADCGPDVPPDAGMPDAGVDAAVLPADVVEVTLPKTTILVDETITGTVTLTHGAPGGQIMYFEADPADAVVLTANLSLQAGDTSAQFQVKGQVPAATVTITANAGANSKSVQLTVQAAALLRGTAPTGILDTSPRSPRTRAR